MRCDPAQVTLTSTICEHFALMDISPRLMASWSCDLTTAGDADAFCRSLPRLHRTWYLVRPVSREGNRIWSLPRCGPRQHFPKLTFVVLFLGTAADMRPSPTRTYTLQEAAFCWEWLKTVAIIVRQLLASRKLSPCS